jgi:hypothetical protein
MQVATHRCMEAVALEEAGRRFVAPGTAVAERRVGEVGACAEVGCLLAQPMWNFIERRRGEAVGPGGEGGGERRVATAAGGVEELPLQLGVC